MHQNAPSERVCCAADKGWEPPPPRRRRRRRISMRRGAPLMPLLSCFICLTGDIVSAAQFAACTQARDCGQGRIRCMPEPNRRRSNAPPYLSRSDAPTFAERDASIEVVCARPPRPPATAPPRPVRRPSEKPSPPLSSNDSPAKRGEGGGGRRSRARRSVGDGAAAAAELAHGRRNKLIVRTTRGASKEVYICLYAGGGSRQPFEMRRRRLRETDRVTS